MADSNSTTIKIEGDTTGFEASLATASKDFQKFVGQLGTTSKAQGQAAGKALSDGIGGGMSKTAMSFKSSLNDIVSTSQGGFSSIASNFTKLVANPVVLGAAAIGASIIAAFNLSKIGEQNDAIAQNFERFAKQAQLNSAALKAGIAAAVDGFADLDDVLPKASEAILKLGANANRLPEIFELSRKIAATTGRELTDVFEDLTRGIQNGNERALKGVLINIDAKKAQEDYAKSLGTTVENLTDAGKQTAILNAVVAQGAKDFQGSAESAKPLEGSIRKLGLAWDNLVDTIADSVVKSGVRDFFASIISGTATAVNSIADAAGATVRFFTGTKTEVETLQGKIAALSLGAALDPTNATKSKEEIAKLTAELERLQNVSSGGASSAKDIGAGLAPSEAVIAKAQEANKAILDSELATAEAIRKIEADNEIARQELIAVQTGKDTELLAAKAQARIDDINATANLELEKAALIKDIGEQNAAEREIKAKRALALTQETNKQEIEAEKKKAADKKAIQEAALTTTQSVISAAAAFAKEGSEVAKALAISDAIINTYRGANLALASAPPPFNFVQAAAVIAAGIANVSKITGARDGALVTGGISGVDTEPFLLSKGEVVVPEKNFEEMFRGIAAQRGLVDRAQASGTSSQAGPTINVVVNGDVLESDQFIDKIGAALRDAIAYRDLRLE